METGTLLHKPRSGRARTSEEGMERIRQSCSCSSTKSIRTALDFFFWDYVKDIVYGTKVKDTSDLKETVTAAVETIDEEMLGRTWTKIEYRLDVLRATNGAA